MAEKTDKHNRTIHLFAGGVGGTLAAVITCPLDVAKTRFQSSLVVQYTALQGVATASINTTGARPATQHSQQIGSLYRFFKHLIRTEGAGALFKGLGPTLVGVAPSRSIYFFTYANFKRLYADLLHGSQTSPSSIVHLTSAATAGAITTTVTNPIWLIKTRLQLDQKRGVPDSTIQCIRRVYSKEGIRGFYRGLTASYYGCIETALHFMIYELLRAEFVERRKGGEKGSGGTSQRLGEVLTFMACAGVSKGVATCLAYPHEVARTRMREEGGRYLRFWQTLRLVAVEEGVQGLYRGLGTQLIKHIPNSAIVLATYEIIVDLCHTFGL